MSKTFRVNLVTVASTTVEVEAEDEQEAAEKAFEQSLPYASAFAGFELGEWELPSEMFPEQNKPEHDVEEVS